MIETPKSMAQLPPMPEDYPPAPWVLRGQMYGSLWFVQSAAITVALPPRFAPLVNFGRACVFAGFVHYQQGSTLVYHEYIAGLATHLRGTRHYALTVTHIGVDDVHSLWGGREIWGVPKEPAVFDFAYAADGRVFGATATGADGSPRYTGDFRAGLAAPRFLRLPILFPNLQELHGQPHYSSPAVRGAPMFCRGGVRVLEDSPLAALGIAERQPFLSFGVRDFAMRLQAARPVAAQ